MNTENFRNDIKAFLKGNMSQVKLAKLSGVPQTTLSSFLTGETKDMGSRHIFALWPIVYGKPLFPEGGKHEEG